MSDILASLFWSSIFPKTRGLPVVRDARRGLPGIRDARRGPPVVRDARRGFPDVQDARCGLPAPQLISQLVILLRQFDGRRFGRRGCGGGFHRSTTAQKRARPRSSATSEKPPANRDDADG